jgi:hypothetical protein
MRVVNALLAGVLIQGTLGCHGETVGHRVIGLNFGRLGR